MKTMSFLRSEVEVKCPLENCDGSIRFEVDTDTVISESYCDCCDATFRGEFTIKVESVRNVQYG